MRRYSITPRPDWERVVSSQGLSYHSIEGRPYWDESAYWEFTSGEVDRLEAAIIQWYWLQDRFPKRDQWNSLHEKLVAKWRDLTKYVQPPLHFAHDGDEEDLLTISYLRDTAREAGIENVAIQMSQIGWDNDHECFVGNGTTPLATLFKLYPWETLLGEPFGMNALVNMASGNKPQKGRTQWIEPIWKMLWANKALLAILWEMYPDHELLLPAYLDSPRDMTRYVRKPLFGREGANISIVNGARSFATDGRFADGPWAYQGLAPVRCVDGNYAVLGSWLSDGEPAGLGVRESQDPVIRNTDRFVPHLS